MKDIEHRQHPWGDIYEGTKEALIASGKCKAEWFPAQLATYKAGNQIRTKRQYKAPGGVDISSRADGRWTVRIPVSEEEKRRRRDAEARTETQGGDVMPATLPEMTFEPGDRVYVLQRLSTVLIGYSLQPFTDHDGTHRQGWGYSVRADGEKDSYFAPAWMVREYPHKPAHIKLVRAHAAKPSEEKHKCHACGRERA
jgi:hypothetical protein